MIGFILNDIYDYEKDSRGNVKRPIAMGQLKINIATLTGYEFIDLQNIVWCKSDGSYTIFYLADKSKIASSRNLGYYEDLLTRNNFCRIHHSVVINMQLIKSYVKGKEGCVTMTDGTELEISQRRKADFLGRLYL
jgi:two-component system LytT family response regulator